VGPTVGVDVFKKIPDPAGCPARNAVTMPATYAIPASHVRMWTVFIGHRIRNSGDIL
jgi:hypothetical protein